MLVMMIQLLVTLGLFLMISSSSLLIAGESRFGHICTSTKMVSFATVKYIGKTTITVYQHV